MSGEYISREAAEDNMRVAKLSAEELAKSLRICAVDGSCRTCPRFTQCTDEEEGPILAGVFNDAADAIEELVRQLAEYKKFGGFLIAHGMFGESVYVPNEPQKAEV